MSELDEGLEGESKYDEGARHLLKGFKTANIKIHLLGE